MPKASAARGMIRPANVLTHPEVADQLIDRDQGGLERDHQARDDHDEENPVASEVEPRQRVGGERVEDEREESHAAARTRNC